MQRRKALRLLHAFAKTADHIAKGIVIPRRAHVKQRADHAAHALFAPGDIQPLCVRTFGDQGGKQRAQKTPVLVHGMSPFLLQDKKRIARGRLKCNVLDQFRFL